MAVLRVSEVRKLPPAERQKKAIELKLELAKERAKGAVGASAGSPGRLREIRKSLARIQTIGAEEARAKPAPADKSKAMRTP